LRCQDSAVPGARMVRMAMRDQGLFDRTGRIDVEATGLATHTRWRRDQDIFRAHRD
jgi:hypothetical protein